MKNSTTSPPPPPSFSSLPDEIIVSCLARVSKSQYGSLSLVSMSFHSLLSSPEIYAARSQIGAEEPRLYLCCDILSTATTRSHRWYNLRTLDDEIIKKGRNAFISVNGAEIKMKTELRLVPVKNSSFHLCDRSEEAKLVFGSDIYQIGGINRNNKRSRSVCVLDCRSHTQRRGPKMKVARQRAKACVLDGRIYVMGGCSEKECWGEVFDVKSQTWKKELLLPSPSGDFKFDCKFEVLALGGRIYVITERNNYAYDPKQGRWLLLDTGFVGLKRILELGTVWCVLDNIVFMEFCDDLFWYDVSCGKWLIVEGLEDLCYTKVNCRYRMVQLVNYGGGKVVIVWLVLPQPVVMRNKQRVIPEEKTCFAVVRLEKRLTSSGLTIWGEIEQLSFSLVHGSYKPLTCLSVSL
ncbi:unnamed protein product [Eruca vesicaria subsp. sativa]|uniref:F-box domain-containing protein n=1 Tax=Eruca vesicaria subsp. sativa TaxID=29727 RepID=A0ABC8JRR8_ERUVS|nr:unnamed protein product [Eruca vesicaria subsp. sativa]